MPGTKTVFEGIKMEKERAGLILYLKEQSFAGNSSRYDSTHPQCVLWPRQVMVNVLVRRDASFAQ